MKLLKFIFLFLLFISKVSYSQKQDLQRIEKELLIASNKLFSAFENNQYDSVEIFNELLRIKMMDELSKYPATLKYPFKMLTDSNALRIVNSEDTMCRIYSWDTWTGGTMHFYNNIFQYSYKGKVTTEFNELEEGDCGSFFSEVFTLKAGSKPYYLVVSNGRFSSKDMNQVLYVWEIENGKLNQNVKLIKTTEGMTSYIGFEYVYSSVFDRPEPLKLIKYDKSKKMIYIPVVYDNGTVTKKFIQYKFNGKYFEKLKTL